MDTNIYERTISHQKRHCNKHKHLVVRSPWDNHQLRHRHSDSKGCSGKRKLRSKMLSCVSLLLFWGSIIITLLLPQTTFAVNSTYYLIPTREGLAVQLMSLNNAYVRVVKSYNRILILVPFTSEHYKDTGWVHLCDYFQLPDNIVCTSETPVDIVTRMPCVVDCSNKDWPCHQDPKIFLNPNFDMESRSTDFGMIVRGTNHMDVDQCGLYVSYDSSRKTEFFQLKPRERWLGLFRLIKRVLQMHAISNSSNSAILATNSSTDNMNISSSSSSSSVSADKYTVLHWRRGDQLSERCKKGGVDNSLNCKDSGEFLKYVNRMKLLDKTLTSFLYVATNEGDVTILEEFEKQGIYSWWTLAKSYNFKMKSIEMFIIELQLMIDADRFLRAHAGFGWFAFTSWIDQLVEIQREFVGKKASEIIDYPP